MPFTEMTELNQYITLKLRNLLFNYFIVMTLEINKYNEAKDWFCFVWYFFLLKREYKV